MTLNSTFKPQKNLRDNIYIFFFFIYYTFMYLFYKAGVVLSYIEAFTAVSARSHNMSQKNSLPIVAEIKPSKLGRSLKNSHRGLGA